jgi:hypothetical protein
MTIFTYRRAWILSSPAAEGRARKIDFRLPVSPLRKIPGAWAERARVSPPACREGRGYLDSYLPTDFSKQSDAGTRH